jgi:hypothetical protein
VAQRDISSLRLATEVRVADITSNRAVGFGVSAEIFTTLDYGVCQLWAAALRRAGFGGIRYWARHDLEHTAACVAVFGAAGAPGEGVRDPLQSPVTEHLSARPDLIAAFESATGVTVLPVPDVDAIISRGDARDG